MKKLLFLLIASTAFIACNNSSKDEKDSNPKDSADKKKESKTSEAPAGGRYGIKSAKVVMATNLPKEMGATVVTTYFDNYGKESYTETTTEMKMKGMPAMPKQILLMDGEYVYSWTAGAKTGVKTKITTYNNPKDIDFEKMAKEAAGNMKIKKIGTETFFGKTCDVYEMDNAQLGKGKFLTWKGIPMRSEMNAMGMAVVTEVKELDENPSIDASKFKAPLDIQFRESPGKTQ